MQVRILSRSRFVKLFIRQMDLGLILFTIGAILATIFEVLYVIHINVKDIEEK